MDAGPTTLRRRLQFNLRTLLLLLIVISVAFGWWVNRSRHWIRQRHEWMAREDIWIGAVTFDLEQPATAPAGLWLFGESGHNRIGVFRVGDQDLAETKRLFPEAEIVIFATPPK